MSTVIHPERLLPEIERAGRPLTARTLLPIAAARAGSGLRLRQLERQRRVETERVRSIVLLGINALQAQLALSLVEQQVVEQSPHSIHGVAMIKDRLNHVLAGHVDVAAGEALR